MSNMFITIKLIAAAMAGKLNEHFGIESQKGVTIIEYALLGALIAAALVGSISGLATTIGTKLTAIGTSIAG
jgi:pilus assembly protein Flp/PilA